MMSEKIVRLPSSKEQAPVSEDSVAALVALEHGRDIRYCPPLGGWFVWTGSRWERDWAGQVFERARQVCRLLSVQTGKEKWGKHSTVAAVEKFCRSDPDLVLHPDGLDASPMLLGTPTGVVDLATGEWRPPKREDLISRSTAVDPAAAGVEPKLWLRFLDEVTRSDTDLIRYLQRLAGYALTGLTLEHTLFFVYGSGGNGKGTFLNAVRSVMGSYAVHAPVETFTGEFGSRHPTELAMLKGARLVTASETEEGHAWAESRIKALTGGDPVTARFMRQDFFTFVPCFKLVIIGNHRPVLKSVDDAAKRRFRIIPFDIQPETPDPDLGAKLQKEAPAILRWMIDGCRDWQAESMDLPAIVKSETFDYFEDQDAMGLWLKDCCEVDRSHTIDEQSWRCLSSRLFGSWVGWSQRNGEKPGTNKAFSEALRRRGFKKKRGGVGIEFFGLRLKPSTEREDGLL